MPRVLQPVNGVGTAPVTALVPCVCGLALMGPGWGPGGGGLLTVHPVYKEHSPENDSLC